ncbi:MAG: copper oxidase [Chloroflexi bacterium]|nr:copper oxidase [Chloroflexota bacterium]
MDTETTDQAAAAAKLGRRRFLQGAGLIGAAAPITGGILLSAYYYNDPTGAPAGLATAKPIAVATPTGTGSTSAAASDADAIDAGHKKGIEDFLKNQTTPLTKGKGNQPLAFKMDGNVKVFDLTVDEVAWETAPGKIEKARGFNGTIPGPIIRATEGERVRINVKNNLTASTTVHWHGVLVPNNMDGVAYLTQEPIKSGASYTYEFTLRNSGTHMYHSHHDSTDQVNRGLLGAFIIDPKDPSTYPKYDKEYILVLNDTMLGFTLNGKGFPATEALTAKKGERVLVRFMNEGMMYHPMHLHGMPMEVFARDGYPVNPPYKTDNLDVPPGSRLDCIIQAEDPGAWAFHCHVLSHAENATGFFGLVTALVITE